MITVTDRAATKIAEKIQHRGRGQGIRIGIRTTGCSGLAYVLEFVDQSNPEDICETVNGCQIYIDPKHEVYLKGLAVDYVRQGLNEGFEFANPNERARCGCGESFTV